MYLYIGGQLAILQWRRLSTRCGTCPYSGPHAPHIKRKNQNAGIRDPAPGTFPFACISPHPSARRLGNKPEPGLILRRGRQRLTDRRHVFWGETAMRKSVSAFAGLILSAVIATSAAAQSFPFSLGGPSSFARGPDRVTLGFGIPFPDDSRTVQSFGGPEDIIVGHALSLLLALTWFSGGGGSSFSSSSAPILAYSLGIEHENNGVEAFRQAGGAVFPTNGSSTFTGIFFGVGYESPMGGGFSSSSVAVPSFGAALNIGYGWAAVDGFGGSFQADGSGIYGRADAYLAIPLAGGMLLIPGISYRVFDYGTIEDSGFLGFLRLSIPL
jgi:hypothetical protein